MQWVYFMVDFHFCFLYCWHDGKRQRFLKFWMRWPEKIQILLPIATAHETGWSSYHCRPLVGSSAYTSAKHLTLWKLRRGVLSFFLSFCVSMELKTTIQFASTTAISQLQNVRSGCNYPKPMKACLLRHILRNCRCAWIVWTKEPTSTAIVWKFRKVSVLFIPCWPGTWTGDKWISPQTLAWGCRNSSGSRLHFRE